MNRFARGVQAAVVLALVGAASTSLVGCSASATNDESTALGASELVTFPAARFASAPAITVGQTHAVQAPANGFGVLRFAGNKNATVTISVTDDETFATPRTTLVEKLANGTFAAVLKSPLTASSTITFRLEATKDYFIVVRAADGGAASFSVKLTSESLCNGAPRTFTAADLGKRMAQATDTLGIDGQLGTPTTSGWRMFSVQAGSTVLDMNGTGMLIDLATGAVTADDPALAAESHVEITDDCVGVENSKYSFSGSIPHVAGRTSLVPTSKPFACESGATLTSDTAIVNRIPTGQDSVAVGQSSLMWTEWRCSSLTGCMQRNGTADESITGDIDVDPSTQELSFSVRHRNGNFNDAADVPLKNGTFAWGNYVGRVTSKFVVLAEKRPYDLTTNGVKRTGEYRAVYCLAW